MRLLVVVQSPILGVLDETQIEPPRTRGLLLLGHPRGMNLIPTALWVAAMEGQVRLAPPVRGGRDPPYPSRWEGQLGRFKPWAWLARGSRTEVGALDSVRLMARTTACAGGLDARRHPCHSRINETETVSTNRHSGRSAGWL